MFCEHRIARCTSRLAGRGGEGRGGEICNDALASSSDRILPSTNHRSQGVTSRSGTRSDERAPGTGPLRPWRDEESRRQCGRPQACYDQRAHPRHLGRGSARRHHREFAHSRAVRAQRQNGARQQRVGGICHQDARQERRYAGLAAHRLKVSGGAVSGSSQFSRNDGQGGRRPGGSGLRQLDSDGSQEDWGEVPEPAVHD